MCQRRGYLQQRKDWSCWPGPLRVTEGVSSFCNPPVHVRRKYVRSDMGLSGFRFRNVPTAQASKGSRQTTFIVAWGTSALNTLKGQEARRHCGSKEPLQLGCSISLDYHSPPTIGGQGGKIWTSRCPIPLHPGTSVCVWEAGREGSESIR